MKIKVKKCTFKMFAWVIVLALLLGSVPVAAVEPKVPAASEPSKRVVAYLQPFTDARWHTPDPNTLTTIIYNATNVQLYDGKYELHRELNRERLEEVLALKAINPKLEVLLGINGGGSDNEWNGPEFRDMTQTQADRADFIQSCLDILAEYPLLDGFDIDYEGPDNASDGAFYAVFMQELRNAIGNSKLLTMAAPCSEWGLRNYSLKSFEANVDWFNVMTYCYTGTWNSQYSVGTHDNNLYYSDAHGRDCNSDKYIQYVLNSHHIAPEKLLLGLQFPPTNAYAWDVGEFTYQDVKNMIASGEYQDNWDDQAKASYLSKNGKFEITYLSPQAIAANADYVEAQNLGGIMYWDYFADDNAHTLAKKVYTSLIGEAQQSYTVTVSAGTGGAAMGSGIFTAGATVDVFAAANTEYTFDGWYENGLKVSSAMMYTFTINSNRTLEARFFNKKYIALTFDDAPNPWHLDVTERCLDMLEEKGVTATFFVIGQYIQQANDNIDNAGWLGAGDELINRMNDEGHEIGNHSWSHLENIWQLSPSDFANTELKPTDAIIGQTLGIPNYKTEYFRMPFLNLSPEMEEACANEGKALISVHGEIFDGNGTESFEYMYQSLINSVGTIVVMHVNNMTSMEACAPGIDTLKAQDVEFVSVTEYLRRKNIEQGLVVEAGETYPDCPYADTGYSTITLAAANGGTVSEGGTFKNGTNITITATPDPGYAFEGWYKWGSSKQANLGSSFEYSVGTDMYYVARFISATDNSKLMVSIVVGEGGTVTGAGLYSHGAWATVTATPNQGYAFEGWYQWGIKVSTDTSFSFQVWGYPPQIYGPLEATFVTQAPAESVVITTPFPTGGTVTGGGSYALGANVTLTTTPDSTHAFDGFYENGSKLQSNGLSISFSAAANRTIEARFNPNKYVVLSLDDAGDAFNMDVFEACLNMLQAKGVVATFFVEGYLLGQNQRAAALVKRAYDEGHELGNHSWDHSEDLWKFPVSDILKQITDTDNAISAAVGTDFTTNYFRLPYGAGSTNIEEASRIAGKPIFNWNSDHNDYDVTFTQQQIYNSFMAAATTDKIPDCNVNQQKAIDAYSQAIDELLSLGYEFITVSDYVSKKGISLNAGEVFPEPWYMDVNYTVNAASGTGGNATGGRAYTKGSTAVLAAVSNSGYTFDGWYEGGSKISGAGASYSFTVTANRTLEARFTQTSASTYTVAANVVTVGVVNDNRDPFVGGWVASGSNWVNSVSGSYQPGGTVTLTAKVNTEWYYEFDGWYENGVKKSSQLSYSFTVDGNKTLECRFKEPDTISEDWAQHTFTKIQHKTSNGVDYYLSYPQNYDYSKKYPVFIINHSAGSTANQWAHWNSWLQLPEDSFIILPSYYTDVLEDDNLQKTERDRTYAEIEYLYNHAAAYGLDTDRFYLYGGSAGGIMCFELNSKNPNMFAAILPIAGGMSGWLDSQAQIDANFARISAAAVNKPIWVVYSQDDELYQQIGENFIPANRFKPVLNPNNTAIYRATNYSGADIKAYVGNPNASVHNEIVTYVIGDEVRRAQYFGWLYKQSSRSVNSLTNTVAGNSITWSAGITSPPAGTQYRFEVYEGTTLVASRDYSASSSYVFIAQHDGDYNLFVTTKSTDKTVFSKYSEVVHVGTVQTYTITATAATGGTVTGGGSYALGANVTLTATPNSGYTFDGWYEGGSKIPSAGAEYLFTVTANRTLEARFTAIVVPAKMAGTYFDPWEWDGRSLPDPNLYTHIFYAFAVLDLNTHEAKISYTGSYVAGSDISDADNLKMLGQLRQINPNLKLILSVGGAGVEGFSDMALTQANRDAFVESLVRLKNEFDLDGFDIDWEFPGAYDPGLTYRPEDGQNYVYLLRDIRAQFGDSISLSIAAPASNWYGQNYNFTQMTPYLDFYNTMTYCLSMGSDLNNCGKGFHDGNLYSNGSPHSSWGGVSSAHDTVQYYLSKGIPASKLAIGIQMPALEYPDKNSNVYYSHNLDAVQEMIDSGEYIYRWDSQAHAAYLEKDGQFTVTYESAGAAREKGAYVLNNGLFGVFSWGMTMDRSDSGVSQAAYEGANGTYTPSNKYSVYTWTKGGGSFAAGAVYNSGANVALSATAAAGYAFDGWYEGLRMVRSIQLPDGSWQDVEIISTPQKVSSSPSYSFNADSNRVLEARFKVAAPELQISSISISGAQQVGSAISFNAVTTGGEAPLKWSFYVYGGGKVYHSELWKGENSSAWTPTSAGTYTVAAYCKDKTGYMVKYVSTFTVS
ncbi:MAG: polysaccharide deacetylase family protein [Oscillospiraceae bacterium]|nr:polysaccharide deacetylase family protein [Oscillospiraceae bacterium]